MSGFAGCLKGLLVVILSAFALLVVIVAIGSCDANPYQNGYDEGYEEGYDEGYADGAKDMKEEFEEKEAQSEASDNAQTGTSSSSRKSSSSSRSKSSSDKESSDLKFSLYDEGSGNSWYVYEDGSKEYTDGFGNVVRDSDGDGEIDMVSTDGGGSWSDY